MSHDASHANGGGQVAIATRSAVRRITPTEAERLQGLPDGWTYVPLRTTKDGKVVMMSDSARYKVIGNAFSSAPVRWVGQRIASLETMTANEEEGAA